MLLYDLILSNTWYKCLTVWGLNWGIGLFCPPKSSVTPRANYLRQSTSFWRIPVFSRVRLQRRLLWTVHLRIFAWSNLIGWRIRRCPKTLTFLNFWTQETDGPTMHFEGRLMQSQWDPSVDGGSVTPRAHYLHQRTGFLKTFEFFQILELEYSKLRVLWGVSCDALHIYVIRFQISYNEMVELPKIPIFVFTPSCVYYITW